jgi:hypothetical protein
MEIDEFRNALRALIFDAKNLDLEALVESLDDAAEQLRTNGAQSFGLIGGADDEELA